MNNVDSNGFPGTEGEDGQFDGGDTAAILGTLIALGDKSIPVGHVNYTRALLVVLGPVRHPDTTKWYGQTDRFSRDQLTPILCSYIVDPGLGLEALRKRHSKRYFLTAWNTKGNGVMDAPTKFPDITGPEVWALWIRALGNDSFMRYLLPILDIETLVGSILWRFKPKSNRVTRNHMLVCIVGLRKYPTITMRLANYINNWDDLKSRWAAHTEAVKEYPTAHLF